MNVNFSYVQCTSYVVHLRKILGNAYIASYTRLYPLPMTWPGTIEHCTMNSVHCTVYNVTTWRNIRTISCSDKVLGVGHVWQETLAAIYYVTLEIS